MILVVHAVQSWPVWAPNSLLCRERTGKNGDCDGFLILTVRIWERKQRVERQISKQQNREFFIAIRVTNATIRDFLLLVADCSGFATGASKGAETGHSLHARTDQAVTLKADIHICLLPRCSLLCRRSTSSPRLPARMTLFRFATISPMPDLLPRTLLSIRLRYPINGRNRQLD